MKTLVVGGSGFIGSYVMRALPQADNLDLKEGRDVRDGIREGHNGVSEGYSRIIFLACDQANTRAAYEYNREMYEALDRCRDWEDEPELVYISSAAIYTPNSWYALSKQLGEAYAKRFTKSAILRLSNVFGHGDGHGAPDRFLRGEKVITGDGTQVRDLVPVEEVVSAILKVETGLYTPIYNVSSGRGISVNEMFRLFGTGAPTYDPTAPVGVQESILAPGDVAW